MINVTQDADDFGRRPLTPPERPAGYLHLALCAAGWTPTTHAGRVAVLAVAIARQLGLPPAQVREVFLAGLVHDLGKLFVPLQVQRKTIALTAREWRQMQRHPVYSARLTRLLPGLSRTVRRAARHHHERWDGTGYPAGLSGETIPLLSRILAVCDVHDALSSPRPYKQAWRPEAVRKELEVQTGRHFDPQIVAALGDVLRWPTLSVLPFETAYACSCAGVPNGVFLESDAGGCRLAQDFAQGAVPGDRSIASAGMNSR